MKPTQSICASGATMKTCSAGQAVAKVEGLERGCGKGRSSGQARGYFLGVKQFLRGTWEEGHQLKKYKKEYKVSFGASQKKCGYRLQCPK